MALTKIKGLQLWCRKMADGYRDVDVKDMTSSFKSGLAFCAIIHRFRPDLIDYDSLSKENVFENNNLAFTVAEQELDIPALLEAADMVAMKVPDKLSIITYVSQYHNYFRDKPQLGGPGVKSAAAGGHVSLKRHTTSPPASAPDSKRFTPVKDNNKANVSTPIQTAKKQTTLGDKCDICHNKVYLLERQIENGKLYHRSCYRHSDFSPTSTLFKNSPSFMGASHKVSPEKSRNENNASWVKGDMVTPKSGVMSDRSKQDMKKNLFSNDYSEDVEMKKTEPKEDAVITRFLSQMKNNEVADVPKYQKKRPLVFQVELDKEEKSSEASLSSPHFNAKIPDKHQDQGLVSTNVKERLKLDKNTNSVSSSKSEQTLNKTGLSLDFSNRGVSNSKSEQSVNRNSPVSEHVPFPRAKQRNLVNQPPQKSNDKKVDTSEVKRQNVVSPVTWNKTELPDVKVRKSVTGRPKTPPPQQFKSGEHLARCGSPDSPDSPPPPLPSSQPPSAPSSAERSNLKSPKNTSNSDIVFETDSSSNPVPKARHVKVHQVQESSTSSPTKPLRSVQTSRTEVPMETDGNTQSEPAAILVIPTEPSKDNKNVLSGLLKSLAHVRQTEDSHPSSSVSDVTSSVSVTSAKSGLPSTNSVSVASLTVTTTKTKSQNNTHISDLKVSKNVTSSEEPSKKIGFLKKDGKNKVLQDLKHPAPSQNKIIQDSKHPPPSQIKDFRMETKLTGNKNQDSSVISSRPGNKTGDKPRPKSAFIFSDSKLTEDNSQVKNGAVSWKKELDKKDKSKSRSTENLLQIGKTKLQQDDNIPSWKKEIEKNKAKKANLLHNNEKDLPTAKVEKKTEAIPSWKKELKKNEPDDNKIKSSVLQDNGNHFSGTKEKAVTNVPPSWKKDTDKNKVEIFKVKLDHLQDNEKVSEVTPSWKKQNIENKPNFSHSQQESGKPVSKSVTSEGSNNVPSWKKEIEKQNAEKSRPKSTHILGLAESENIKDKNVSNLKPETKAPVPKKRGAHVVNGDTRTPPGKPDRPKTTGHLLEKQVDDNLPAWQMEAKRRLQVNQREFVDPEKGRMPDSVFKNESKKMVDQAETPEIVSNKINQPNSNVYHSTPKSSISDLTPKSPTPISILKSPVSETKPKFPVSDSTQKSPLSEPKSKFPVFDSTSKSPGSQPNVRVPVKPPPARPPSPPHQLKKISVDTSFTFSFKPGAANSKMPTISPIAPPKKLTPPRPPPPNLNALTHTKVAPPRPPPPKCRLSPGRLNPEEFQTQLIDIDSKLTELELRGRELEDSIRNASTTEEEDDMMIEWFKLISAKNDLVRKEADLVYQNEEQNLVDEQENLDAELRRLLNKPDSEKTEAEKEHEKFLLDKKLGVVNARAGIVDSMDEDKQRYEEEDQHIAELINQKGFCHNAVSGKIDKAKEQKNKTTKSTWYT